jgi:hypothetical protein
MNTKAASYSQANNPLLHDFQGTYLRPPPIVTKPQPIPKKLAVLKVKQQSSQTENSCDKAWKKSEFAELIKILSGPIPWQKLQNWSAFGIRRKKRVLLPQLLYVGILDD